MSEPVFANKNYAEAYKSEYLAKARLHYPPLWVTLGICSPCPYHCQFCAYHSLDARKISNVYNVRYVMPKAQAESLIDFFYRGGVPKIHICATGEPLYHPAFFEILDYVIVRYGSVSFQSNFPAQLVAKRDALNNLHKRKGKISAITVDLMDDPASKGADCELYEILREIQNANGCKINAGFLLTRKNWRNLESVIRSISRYRLDVSLKTVRVFAYGMNEFTSPENAWHKELLTKEENDGIKAIQRLAQSLGVKFYLFDSAAKCRCDVFWKKLQIWPTVGSKTGRLDNLIPQACNAVVLGEMNSLGYASDYATVFDLWNNPVLLKIRADLLAGIYPDKFCKACPNMAGAFQSAPLNESDQKQAECSHG